MKIHYVLAFDQAKHRTCLINQNKFNLHSQAIGSRLILPFKDAKKYVNADVPVCNDKVGSNA